MSKTNKHGEQVAPMEIAVRSIVAPTQQGRTENEDNYLLIDETGCARFLQSQREARQTLADWPAGHRRLAVLDGMGGHSYGREAAELTVAGLLALPAAADLATLAAGLEGLHRQLRRTMHDAGNEPGCTLTLVEIPPTGPALLFHVSDSRLYRINADRAVCLTIDHVPATRLALRGQLDAAQWQTLVHERNGFQITQAFVLGNNLDPALAETELSADLYELHAGNLPPFLQGLGDRRTLDLVSGVVYLLASDGLWHLSRPQEFVQRWPTILGRADKPLKVLLDDLFVELIMATHNEPLLRGDNCTALAFRLAATTP